MRRVHALKRLAAALGLLLLACTAARAEQLIMPGLSAQWVAEDMTLNGIPASMRTVAGSMPLVDVLRYYRRLWAGELQERIEGEWRVLAIRQRDRFITLRLQSAGVGVEGVLTVSADPSSHQASLDSDFPVPRGLTRLAHQSFRDGSLYGENLTLMSGRSVAYERQAFDALLRGQGWTLAEDRVATTVPDAHVMHFVRAKQQARVFIYRDPELANGNALILVTWQRP